jgi:hypothetical protein
MAEEAPAFLPEPRGRDYVLTRNVLLRALGAMYAVAFLILVRQVLPLIGSRGLLPVEPFLRRASEILGPGTVLRLPSLFWISASDTALVLGAWLGLLLALLVVAGIANAPILLGLWALYLSFCHVGQVFYGYGWDSLLCEMGFLAVFLAPPLRPRLPGNDEPPFLVVVLFRWLTFRLMFGAGLIKLRGDPCWTALRCLDFHYETQPNPGPLSALFHFMPRWTHSAGVLMNHVAELVAPFGVFGPRRVRLVAGVVIVAFQALIILSGNLSFLNWLTIVAALACFDDAALRRLLPARFRAGSPPLVPPTKRRRITIAALGVVVGLLSIPPAVNLLSSRQLMNASFEPFDLVNTYGAFGSVSKVRREVVLEGTLDDAFDPRAVYREYEFPCKPTSLTRRPCLVTPYHYRLDWQMWFAGLSNFEREPWIVHLSYLLLSGEPSVKQHFVNDPFPDRPPRFVRARLYRYRFAEPGSGRVWERTLETEYLLPLSLDHPEFRRFLRAYGWLEEGGGRSSR